MHLPACKAVQVGTAGSLAPVFSLATSGYEAQCSPLAFPAGRQQMCWRLKLGKVLLKRHVIQVHWCL